MRNSLSLRTAKLIEDVMDIDLNSDDLHFQKSVRQFLSDNSYVAGSDYNEWRLNWFRLARDQGGWDVPKWPEKFGGPGWTPTQHYIWEQETARAQTPWDLPFGLSMLAPVLMNYGSEEQQQRFLPDIRDRKVNWCQGYSEPNAGSDLANLKTKAELSADGSHYVVNGTKIWTTLAHIADWIFCLTRTDDSGKKQDGITFLLIPMKQAGIEVKPIITLGGAHSVNMVHLTDVKVPVENRVGEEGKAWTYAKGLLAHERTGLAGISRSLVALEKLRKQAGSVTRGNGSLLDDPSYRLKVAELEVELMATEFTELRSLASAAAPRFNNGCKSLPSRQEGFILRPGGQPRWAIHLPTAACLATWPAAPIRSTAAPQRCSGMLLRKMCWG